MSESTGNSPNSVRGVIGAVGGGVLGVIGFGLLLRLGLYGMVVPGAMVGWACGAQSGGRSVPLGIFCAMLATATCLYTEWHFFSFVADDSFSYFLSHLNDLKLRTTLSIAAGIFAAFWFGKGR
ncbi:MAG: hypothetical protein ABGZ53_13885 [Fuerstiella sp.]|jgi:hypothetical protein